MAWPTSESSLDPGLLAIQHPVQRVAGRAPAGEPTAAHRDPPTGDRGKVDRERPPAMAAEGEARRRAPSCAPAASRQEQRR